MKKQKTYDRILIVRTDRIGDVMITTSTFRPIKETYPHCYLAVMVNPSTRDLVEENPYVDEVIIYDRLGEHKGLRGFLKFISCLRKKKFDVVINYHTKNRTNLLCFWAAIPRRIGYDNGKMGFLLTDRIKDTRAWGVKHEAEYCLDLLKSIGVKNGNIQYYLPIQQQARQWVEELFVRYGLTNRRVIIVHPGASCPSKRWPISNFIGLISQLLKKYPWQIVVIGDSETKDLTQQIANHFKDAIIDLTGLTTMAQLSALFSKSHLMISNDSGPLHMASAVGVPVICIYGRDQAGLNPVRWRPLGSQAIILHKDIGCDNCLAHRCRIHFECLEAVKSEDVLEAVDVISRTW